MKVSNHKSADEANAAAADLVARWLTEPQTRNVMPAAGNTPLDLYQRIAEKQLRLRRLNIFILDEYVGVPKTEPRNCVNLLRGHVRDAWNIPPEQFSGLSSEPADALPTLLDHERRIDVILGLGQNGHLGFNEPGSAETSRARLVPLEPSSVEANRIWFGGQFAPVQGATIGLKTILASRRILIMAYGPAKAGAVQAMIQGPRGPQCPASFLQGHPETYAFLDHAAAARLQPPG